MAGASGRLVTATTKTDRHLPSSSTSGNTSPRHRIPSLKSPFLREAKTKLPHMISCGAEQRAALITLGAVDKKQGIFLSETEMESVDLLSADDKKQGVFLSETEVESIDLLSAADKKQGVFLSETEVKSVDLPSAADKKQGVFLSETEAKSIDLLSPLAYEITRRMILRALAGQCWSKIIERRIHQTIVRCQSFTLIGVAGSLLGSIPLFLEGCAVVIKSYFMRFHHVVSHTVDHGETIRQLIEAMNMFLIGTALLAFGMGMYTMVYGSHSIQTQARHIDTSHSHLGAFNLKKLKEGAKIRCVMQGKARIGHAILLLLQVGILENFKSVPLVTGLDMACFAGAVLASSASVFVLSKLDMSRRQSKQSFA